MKGSAMDMPKISVVMPTHDKAPYLALTLASFVGQSFRDFELIVVDDGSTDDTREVLSRYGDRLPLRPVHRTQGGRAAARNSGLAAARGEVIVFNDDDRLVAPSFLAEHWARQRQGEAAVIGRLGAVLGVWDPALNLGEQLIVGLLAKRPEVIGRLRPAERCALITEDCVRDRFDETVMSASVDDPYWTSHMAGVVARFGERLDGLTLGWYMGLTSNLSVPARAVKQAGGFDERYVTWGGEDIDLACRLAASGLGFTMSTSAVNYHLLHPRPTDKDAFLSNMRYFVDKHDSLSTLLYARWIAGASTMEDANALLTALAELPESSNRRLTSELRALYRDWADHILGKART